MRLMDFIPFALATVGGASGPPKLSTARVIEALIIAAITAMASSYMTIKVLQVEIREVKGRMIQLEDRVEKMRGDLYEPRRYRGGP